MSFPAFKGIRIYKLTEPVPHTAEALSESFKAHSFSPCLGQIRQRTGFSVPLHKSIGQLAYQSGRTLVFAVKTQTKILPKDSVNDEMAPKIEARELELGRPLGRKETTAIREAVESELLPRCLTKTRVVHGYIDADRQIMVIGTGSSNTAEDVLALVRKAIGSLPALPFFDGVKLADSLQWWARNEKLPAGMALGHKVKFKAPDEDGGKASFDNLLLTAGEVQAHFEDKLAVLLELSLPDEMRFVVKDDGSLTGIKYSDILMNNNDELGWDDLPARLDADMLLLSSSLGKVIDLLAVETATEVKADV